MRKFHLFARSLVLAVPILFFALSGWGTSTSLGWLLLAAGILGGAAGFLWRLMEGRNEVYGSGGAADASSLAMADRDGPTSMVTDLALPKMATVQFDPPPGIAPWEGMVLLSERYDSDAVLEAYFSGLAGAGVIEIRQDGDETSCVPGPEFDSASADDRFRVESLFEIANPFVFGTRDRRLAPLVASLHADLQAHLRRRGFWRHGTPRERSSRVARALIVTVRVVGTVWGFLLLVALLDALGVAHYLRFLESVPALALWIFAGALWLGRRMFAVLSPSRSAIGSALTLHTESFRRFLHDSESEQVQQALDRGVLREYAGWAVALDETEAWSDAIGKLNISLFPFMVRDMWSFLRDPVAHQAKMRSERGRTNIESLLGGLGTGIGLPRGNAVDLLGDLPLGEGGDGDQDVVREEILRDASGQEIGRRTFRFTVRRTTRD